MVGLHKRETEATQAPDSSVAVSPAGFQILPRNSPPAPGPLLALGNTLVMYHSPLLQAFAELVPERRPSALWDYMRGNAGSNLERKENFKVTAANTLEGSLKSQMIKSGKEKTKKN